ncbi:MAG: Cys-tRNA(Pro) deacylase [Denitrovibrio sp.]|nr:MAG: Cys-tRNA(Pro) deacylase [Denitrovibrio sp.]
MAKEKYPITPAIRELRKHKVDFQPHVYDYVERGGAAHSADVLGADLNVVIKTIILQDETTQPYVVLMHGDKDISTKNLAREIGVKMLKPCDPDFATKLTGYLVGGTSPFGTKKQMKTYMEKTIADIDTIYINGGKRGFLVSMKTTDLLKVLNPHLVSVAIDK